MPQQSLFAKSRLLRLVLKQTGPPSRASDAMDALDFEELTLNANTLDYDEVCFPPQAKVSLDPSSGIQISNRHDAAALGEQDLENFLDADGRLVDEHRFRQAVFRGGILPNIRKKAWHFLFGLFPFHSTRREREILLAEYQLKYIALKKRWKMHLEHKERSCEDCSRLSEPVYLSAVPPSPANSPPQSPDADVMQQIQCLQLQAQVYAGRLAMNVDSLITDVRIIDKDVPRTDRQSEYFSGDTLHLRMLRNVLVTYAAVHPAVGYTQGMNDIASRFLSVFDSEVEAYWCFEKYMERTKADFLEDGLLNKLTSARHLLNELDADLMGYIDHLQLGDMTFCHRWMLLSFKREFKYEDSMRCFEILSSRHLEVFGPEAERTRDLERRRDFEKQGGKCRVTEAPSSPDFTFEVFMCVTILLQNREVIFSCQDTSDLFAFVSGLTMKLDLPSLLRDSEVLFYKYCQKSIVDCFQVLDVPSPTKKKPTL